MLKEKKSSMSLELFYEMLRIRTVEERIASKYPEQKMRCPVHLSIGQEAVAVGVCKAVLHSDFLISGHRAHAHYLAKGGDLKSMIAEIYGRATGCVMGRGGSMHLFDPTVGMMGSTPIIGSSMPVAIGFAFATVLKNEDQLMVIFLGDAATEEGIFSECMNFAALKNLPVLFVCENNLYSVYSPLDVRQPKNRDIVKIAKAHGLWSEKEYGNDVEKVYSLSQKAVQRIRSKKGPCLLEFSTYRYREHCGPYFDKNLDYRAKEEYELWEDRCPIKTTQQKLLKDKLLNEIELNEMQNAIDQEITEAFAFAEMSPFPNPNDPQPLYSV